MKKRLALFVLVLCIAPVLSAQESLKDVVREYQQKNSEFTMVVPRFLLKMGLAYGDLDEAERDVLKQIDHMKIVISDNGFFGDEMSMLDDGIKKGQFKEIMTVYDQKDKVRMVYNQKNERKSELLMLVEDGSEHVMILMNINGKPDFSKFMVLAD
ncbi:MAG: DUF4252 domain-containing protein [Bacteroidales bacterium]|jgi:hypothetical protein|nr:DUF4252 domain-containing protein [Bacteroidales bacterium]